MPTKMIPVMGIGRAYYVEAEPKPHNLRDGVCPQCDLCSTPACGVAIDTASKQSFGGDCMKRDVVYKEVARPFPRGSLIEFCGTQATVIADRGNRVEVRDSDGQRAFWYWRFDGADCELIALPRPLNLTPKRIEALRLIRDNPGCYVCLIANRLLAGDRKSGLWAQQATRSGAGYCIKLEKAGLVDINRHTEHGFGKVTLTQYGHQALEAADKQTDARLAAANDADVSARKKAQGL